MRSIVVKIYTFFSYDFQICNFKISTFCNLCQLFVDKDLVERESCSFLLDRKNRTRTIWKSHLKLNVSLVKASASRFICHHKSEDWSRNKEYLSRLAATDLQLFPGKTLMQSSGCELLLSGTENKLFEVLTRLFILK